MDSVDAAKYVVKAAVDIVIWIVFGIWLIAARDRREEAIWWMVIGRMAYVEWTDNKLWRNHHDDDPMCPHPASGAITAVFDVWGFMEWIWWSNSCPPVVTLAEEDIFYGVDYFI